MLELWGRKSAFNVQKAMWLLGELGLAYRQVEAGGAAGGLDTPEFLALNPHGRVPVLRDGELVVWESHTILRYLGATYGAGSVWARDAGERSQAERWMDWAHTTLQPAFMDLFWNGYRMPEAKRDAQVIGAAAARCAQAFGVLDAHLACRPFVAGDAFTMGDIPAGTALYRYFEMGHRVPPLPAIRAWYARLQQRPAFRTAVMQPFEELRGRESY